MDISPFLHGLSCGTNEGSSSAKLAAIFSPRVTWMPWTDGRISVGKSHGAFSSNPWEDSPNNYVYIIIYYILILYIIYINNIYHAIYIKYFIINYI